MAQCPLCLDNATAVPAGDVSKFNCPSCGEFTISGTAMTALEHDRRFAFDVAFWVHHQNRAGLRPEVTDHVLGQIKLLPRPSVQQRAEFYLGQAIRMGKGQLYAHFDPANAKLRVASNSEDSNDARALAEYLAAQGALATTASIFYRITPQSYIYHDKLAAVRASSSQAFIAMWFSEEMRSVYEDGFEPAVRGAGYEPMRIDRKETDARIDDEIIAEIRRSAFVIADFTGHRAGVYYEAGFAHGLNKRVIFTCRKPELEGLHFDVRQYNTIDWHNAEDLKVRLQTRISAIMGDGPNLAAVKH